MLYLVLSDEVVTSFIHLTNILAQKKAEARRAEKEAGANSSAEFLSESVAAPLTEVLTESAPLPSGQRSPEDMIAMDNKDQGGPSAASATEENHMINSDEAKKSAIVIQNSVRRKEAETLVAELNAAALKIQSRIRMNAAKVYRAEHAARIMAAVTKMQRQFRRRLAQRDYEAVVMLYRKMQGMLEESRMLIALSGTLQGSTGWCARLAFHQ